MISSISILICSPRGMIFIFNGSYTSALPHLFTLNVPLRNFLLIKPVDISVIDTCPGYKSLGLR